MEKILVSACLLGDKCRYDGGDCYSPFFEKLKKHYTIVPFCPEVAGGLTTPRVPAEISHSEVFTKDGVNVTKNYISGAEKALQTCKFFGVTIAILKDNSPACGSRKIYDGSFKNNLINGKGLTANYLIQNGITVYSDTDELDFLIPEEVEKDVHETNVYASRGGHYMTQQYQNREDRHFNPDDEENSSRNYRDRDNGSYRKFNDHKKPFDRDNDRKSYNRDGRKSFRNHDDHKSYGNRDGYKKSYGDRDDRKSYGSRDGYKKSYGDRDSSKSYGSRDGGYKKSYGSRDGGYKKPFNRDGKKSFHKDGYKKPYKSSGGNRDGYKKSFRNSNDRNKSYNKNTQNSFSSSDSSKRTYGGKSKSSGYGSYHSSDRVKSSYSSNKKNNK